MSGDKSKDIELDYHPEGMDTDCGMRTRHPQESAIRAIPRNQPTRNLEHTSKRESTMVIITKSAVALLVLMVTTGPDASVATKVKREDLMVRCAFFLAAGRDLGLTLSAVLCYPDGQCPHCCHKGYIIF
jgi:hypothetical protein